MISNPVAELKSTPLWKYLFSIDKVYANYCLDFVKEISPILKTIVDYFPNYTRHDAHHSYNVVKRISEILKPECLDKKSDTHLTKVETFLLICSSYGHDLGMTVLPDEEDEILNKTGITKKGSWKTNKVLQDELRKTHSLRGGLYINNNYKKLNVPPHLRRILNLMMEAHNYSSTELYDKLKSNVPAENEIIDLMQLASIFCVADLLEYSDTRVIDGVIDKLLKEIESNPDDDTLKSLHENSKHDSIRGNVVIDSDGKVAINGSFDDPDVLNLAYKTADDMQSWLRVYYDIDRKAKKKRFRVRDSIDADIGILGKDFQRLGIRIKKENIIGLISSNSVWINRQEFVIRELLQNSVEACRYRKYNSPISERYKPDIKIIFSKTERTIIVEDNGCGMSRTVILDNFLTVGNSRSKDATYAGNDYNSLARFGIGFWSVFTIADFVEIETTPYSPGNTSVRSSGLTFKVNINTFKDYTVFVPITIPIGTRIKLYLKSNININELFNKIRGDFGIIHCSKIPIKIQYGTHKYSIPKDPQLPEKKELFGPKLQFANDQNIELFQRQVKQGDFFFGSYFLYKKNESQITFKLTEESMPFLTTKVHGYHINCICGFPSHIPPYLNLEEILSDRYFGYITNKNNPKGFVYNLNRQTLLPSPEYLHYSKEMSRFCIESYRIFLKKFQMYDNENIHRLSEESRIGSGRQGGLDTTNILERYVEMASDLYSFRLLKIEKEKFASNCIIEYNNLSELLARDVTIINYFPHFNIHDLRIRHDFYPVDIFYEILKSGINTSTKTFFHDSRSHLLFDNDPDGYLLTVKFRLANQNIPMVFLVSNTKTVNPRLPKSWIIGVVHGIWSGVIIKRKIVGSKFVMGQSIFFVHLDSELSSDLEKLFADGNHFEICNIINLLGAALSGHVDPLVKKYM